MEILANKLYKGGKIKDKCEKAGFYHRLILIEEQFKGSAVLLHKIGHLPTGFQQFWANERLLNIVEQLVGPDIAGECYIKGGYILLIVQVTQYGTSGLRHLTMNKPQYLGTRTMLTWILQLSTPSCLLHGSHSLTPMSLMAACRYLMCYIL